MKELVLKLSTKFKKVSEWKLEAQKDIPKLKKKMKIIFDEREKIENDLINSIMRSSDDGGSLKTDEDTPQTIAHLQPTPMNEPLPNFKKLNHKSPKGAKLNIRIENFDTAMSPRDISLPRLNFSTKNDGGMFSVRQNKIPGFENPISLKQKRIASKRASVVHQLNAMNRNVKKNNLMTEESMTSRGMTTAPQTQDYYSVGTSVENLNLSYDTKPSLKSIRSNVRIVKQNSTIKSGT